MSNKISPITSLEEKKRSLYEDDKSECKQLLKEIGIDFDIGKIKDTKKLLKKFKTIVRQHSFDYPDFTTTAGGLVKPHLTTRNIGILINKLGYKIIYDEILQDILFTKNNKQYEFSEISNKVEDELQKQTFSKTNYDILCRKLKNLGKENSINPIKDYILKSYDKFKNKINYNKLELDKLFKTIKGRKEDEKINYMLFKTYMLSRISCQFNPDFACQGALTFTGKQGAGKTTWCENLTPPELRNYHVSESRYIPGDRDNKMKNIRAWSVEFAEVGRTLKEVDATKAFITTKTDTYRDWYESKSEKHKRRTVYTATVDKDEFLVDDVDRRWWPIKIIDYFGRLNNLNYELLYAELYQMYLENPKNCHELGKEGLKILNKHNKEFRKKDYVESLLMNTFDWQSEPRYKVPNTDIITLITNDSSINSKINNTNLGLALKKMDVEYEIKDKKTKQKLYYVPVPRKIKKNILSVFLEQKYEQVYETIERESIIKQDESKINKG
ncbi:MAG: VapE family protein [Candidatus Pacearchaeota archaeon]|jgi:predicted P-loop ATPase